MRLAFASPPRPAPRGRVVAILGFWLAAGGLVLGQYLLLRHLASLNWTAMRIMLVPSPWWRTAGTFLPLFIVGTALLLHLRWLKGAWSAFAGMALVAFVPFAAICLFFAWLAGPWALERLNIPAGGARVVLAVDEGMTDVGFILFEEADPAGLVWRSISELNYIQDGPYSARPQLVLAPNSQWLLVRRAGIWTDVFRIVDGQPVPVAVPPGAAARVPDETEFRRLRSARISSLTGLQP